VSDESRKPKDRLRHVAAVALVVIGVLLLAAICAFVWIAMGFGASFAGTYRPVEDLILGFGVLSPFVIFALVLIGYGRHLLRKE
jgi:hypothetical protein